MSAQALATSFRRAGHNVIIASRDPEDAGSRRRGHRRARRGLERRRGRRGRDRRAGDPVRQCPRRRGRDRGCRRRQARHRRRPTACRSAPTGPDIDTTTSNAEELAALLPDAHVVKAFNTLFASHQADPIAEGIQLDGYVAGDDADRQGRRSSSSSPRSASIRSTSVRSARARQLEGLAFLNITLNIANGGSWQSGWKLVGAPATVKAAA